MQLLSLNFCISQYIICIRYCLALAAPSQAYSMNDINSCCCSCIWMEYDPIIDVLHALHRDFQPFSVITACLHFIFIAWEHDGNKGAKSHITCSQYELVVTNIVCRGCFKFSYAIYYFFALIFVFLCAISSKAFKRLSPWMERYTTRIGYR